MKYGDLANKPSPALLLVFEGALGILPDEDRRRFDKVMKRHRYDLAVRYWQIQEMYARQILYLIHRLDYNIEIVTFLGDEFAAELGVYLDEQGLPVRRVWATTPTLLARQVAYMPDLYKVYDPDPDRWLTYGHWGTYIRSHTQLGA